MRDSEIKERPGECYEWRQKDRPIGLNSFGVKSV